MHLVSLDGHPYTFNGHGEFTLLQSIDGSVNVQVRMVEPEGTNVTLAGVGTVITAIVAKHDDSDTVLFEK
jgi:deleted-in-malignant-brain-tumors protein 1